MRSASRIPIRLFSQFPPGIGTLFSVQMFATLSFSVLYSTLVLYMTRSLGFSKIEANTITGFFLAFNYGLHLLGGVFSGRLISHRLLFSLGMLLTVVACACLSIPSRPMFYIGMAIFLTGSGLNVTCLNCMVTQLFEPADPKRENAFFWIYSGMNIGFFIGFSVSGIFEQSGNYHWLFMIGGMGNLLALFLVFSNWHLLRDKGTVLSKLEATARRKRQAIGISLVFAMVPALLFLLSYASIANRLVLTSGCLMILVLLTLAFQQQHRFQTKKMIAFVILMICSLVFWSLYQIAPMGLTLFIKHNVDTQLFGFAITPQWIQNVNTVVVVIGGPLLSLLYTRLRNQGYNINIPFQFSCALLLIGLAFKIIPLGIANANQAGLTSIHWILSSYFLQSIGELLLSPVGYAMIGRLAPKNLQAIMMGSWMMMTGVAATMSNYFSNMMVGTGESNDALVTNPGFSQVFSMIGWIAVIAAVVLFLLTPTLKRLIEAGDGDSSSEALEGVDVPEPEVA